MIRSKFIPQIFAGFYYSNDNKTIGCHTQIPSLGDCKLPNVENAVMDTSLDIISHSGELIVECGEKTIVLKCEHGSWDQTLVFCPGK